LSQQLVSVMFSWRLLLAQGLPRYADLIERTERVLAAREFATIATTEEFVASAAVLAR